VKPVNFPQSNVIFKGSVPEIADLDVYDDGEAHWSLWELSGVELAQVLQSKRIWLRVLGDGHPPIALMVDDLEKPLFQDQDTGEAPKNGNGA